MTERDNLIEAYKTTPAWQKPSLLRLIKEIDDKNDKKLEALRSEVHFLENTMNPDLTVEQVVTRMKEVLG